MQTIKVIPKAQIANITVPSDAVVILNDGLYLTVAKVEKANAKQFDRIVQVFSKEVAELTDGYIIDWNDKDVNEFYETELISMVKKLVTIYLFTLTVKNYVKTLVL